MKLIITILLLLCFVTFLSGQRIVGKFYYRFSNSYSIDTFLIGKTSRFSISADTIHSGMGRAIKLYHTSRISKSQADLCDQIIETKLMSAILYRDSVLFITYKYDSSGHKVQSKDFEYFKSQHSKKFESEYEVEKNGIKRSDRYYSSFENEGTWFVVLFDPLENIGFMRGDVLEADFVEPIVINSKTKKIYFIETVSFK